MFFGQDFAKAIYTLMVMCVLVGAALFALFYFGGGFLFHHLHFSWK